MVAIAGSGGDERASRPRDFPAEAHIQAGAAASRRTSSPTTARAPRRRPSSRRTSSGGREAGCELQLDLPDEGNTHVEADTVDYKTNPPTSGDHNPSSRPTAPTRMLPEPVNFVHSLEHGRIEIQYSPDLSEDEQLAIKGVFDEDPAGMLLFPNPEMPYEVAATAWTQLLGCPQLRGRRDPRRDPRLPRHLPRPGPRAGADSALGLSAPRGPRNPCKSATLARGTTTPARTRAG